MSGFQAIRSIGSSEFCGQVETFTVLSGTGNIAIGDIVDYSAVASGADNAVDGVAAVVPGLANSAIGVVAGFKVNPSNLLTTGHLSGDPSDAFVSIDPNQVYEIEVDGTLPDTAVGNNANAVVAVPTVSGQLITSNYKLSTTTVPALTTGLFNIMGFREGGTIAIVRFNANRVRAGVAGST